LQRRRHGRPLTTLRRMCPRIYEAPIAHLRPFKSARGLPHPAPPQTQLHGVACLAAPVLRRLCRWQRMDQGRGKSVRSRFEEGSLSFPVPGCAIPRCIFANRASGATCDTAARILLPNPATTLSSPFTMASNPSRATSAAFEEIGFGCARHQAGHAHASALQLIAQRHGK